jgi:hypothetical protein
MKVVDIDNVAHFSEVSNFSMSTCWKVQKLEKQQISKTKFSFASLAIPVILIATDCVSFLAIENEFENSQVVRKKESELVDPNIHLII